MQLPYAGTTRNYEGTQYVGLYCKRISVQEQRWLGPYETTSGMDPDDMTFRLLCTVLMSVHRYTAD